MAEIARKQPIRSAEILCVGTELLLGDIVNTNAAYLSRALAALGIRSSDASQSASGDINLLARLISAEARGEPYNGQVAVGAVVLNRMKHPSFPNTMSGVIVPTSALKASAAMGSPSA